MDLEGAAASPSCAWLTAELIPTAGVGAGEDALPFGAVLHPLAPLSEDLVLRRDALRCTGCLGYIGLHCQVSRGSWRCGLCSAENQSLTLSTSLPGELAAQREMCEPVVEYVVRPPARVPSARHTAAKADAVVLFLVDGTATGEALADSLAAVREALPLLPPDTLVGLLSFGRTVRVYLCGRGNGSSAGIVEALCFPAAEPPVQWELDLLRAKASLAVAPRSECELQLLRALGALQSAAAAVPPSAATAAASRPGGGARALLAAIDLALDLVGSLPSQPWGGELVVLPLAGPPSVGPGALPSAVTTASDKGDAARPRDAQLGRRPRPPPPPPRTPARDAALAALRTAGSRLGRAGFSASLFCAAARPRVFDVEALRSLVRTGAFEALGRLGWPRACDPPLPPWTGWGGRR